MATRIYLRETARCAKPKFKPVNPAAGGSSSEAHVILEIDRRTGAISLVKNRYGKCGVLA